MEYTVISTTEHHDDGCSSDLKGSSFSLRLYKKRWLMLAIFSTYLLVSTLQWIQYSIITNLVAKYYNVSYESVDWTSMTIFLCFIVFMIPACFLLDKYGLRWCILLSAAVTAVGSWLKVIAISPDLFYMVLIAQVFTGIGQVLVLGIPPRLATVWFGANEVSTASSIALFGNQAGIAAGFLLPPLMVKHHDKPEDIGKDLKLMFLLTASASTLFFLLIIFFFEDRPAFPPNIVQAKEKLTTRSVTMRNFIEAIKRLFMNPNYRIMLLGFGINIGVFNAICTLLNQLVLIHFENGEEFAGYVGLVITVGGTLGSVVFGILLDKTHSFKLTNVTVYFLSFVSTLGFSFILATGSEIAVYILTILLGIFMGGYFVVGFEFSTEMTYPESESTTAGLLLIAPSILGIIFTMTYSWLIEIIGDMWGGALMSVTLLLGTVLSIFIKPDYRRLLGNTMPSLKCETSIEAVES